MSHLDDPTTAADLTLVEAARAGDRLAFGVLYLRHHAAAWRVACVVSRFSPDAELALIEGFTRVFSALPGGSEEFAAEGVSFRPYLLACVRQAALDRAAAAGRGEGATAEPMPLAGLGPDGEVVLSSLEHHAARGALTASPERARTALWLTDVEALTPAEVAGILIGEADETAALATSARTGLHAAQEAAFGRQEVRAGCRFSVDHLDGYQAGTLDPSQGLIVRAHLQNCQVCQMRQGELATSRAALAAAVPAAPLLGGEAQHHWLTAGALHPAERLLPPGVAAGGVAPREPLAHRAATHLGSVAGAAILPARRLPGALRRAGRAAAGALHTGDIDLTTRARLKATGAGTDPSTYGPIGRPGSATRGAPDPTVPPGWTGSPGWSGSPVPSLPPAWTAPPRRNPTPRRRRNSGPANVDLTLGAPVATPASRRRRGWRNPLRAFSPETAPEPGRRGRATLPVLGLVVAWLMVMALLPQLLAPGTDLGPDGMALPAVQAYVPGFGAGAPRAGRPPAAGGAGKGSTRQTLLPNPAPDAGGGADGLALAVAADGSQSAGGVIATSAGKTADRLSGRQSAAGNPGRPPGAGSPAKHLGPAGPAVVPVTVAATTAPVLTATPPATPTADAPITTESIGAPQPASPKPGTPGKLSTKPATPAKPEAPKPSKGPADRPARPGKARADEPTKPGRSSKPAKDTTGRAKSGKNTNAGKSGEAGTPSRRIITA